MRDALACGRTWSVEILSAGVAMTSDSGREGRRIVIAAIAGVI